MAEWFIQNHEDVIVVTERTSIEQRNETVLKQKTQCARNNSKPRRKLVMLAHNRSKNGVASLACGAGVQVFFS